MIYYDKLTYKTFSGADKDNWLGNLRWYVEETENGKFSFSCISALPQMTHEECVDINMTKKLFDLVIKSSVSNERVYGADYIQSSDFKVSMPFYEYGALIETTKKAEIQFDGVAYFENGIYVIKTGLYYVAIKSSSKTEILNNSLIIDDNSDWIAVEYGIDKQKVINNCENLFEKKEKIIADNKFFWESYLSSCPIVELKNDFTYRHESYNVSEHFTSGEVINRQLWHYWCVLINVSEVEFNKFPLYMAPDKPNWKGTWSNDGPQCMAALSLTNQYELSKRIIVSYLSNALTENGEMSWYMHPDGVGCFGVVGDVGRFSHGDPYMPQVVNYYIKNTNDVSILDEDTGGLTVYEKLKRYVLNLHFLRDKNNDSLIEWSNLWETGWDDKGGTFFSSAPLEKWMRVVSKGTDKEIFEFYKENQHPVIAIVEQVITLWSLKAMSHLTILKNDNQLKEYCDNKYNEMKKTVSEKCWNEKDGFYYDIDVKSNTQTTEKSADAFYWMNFEENDCRNKELLHHINNENEFNCYYIPMLSKDSKGFNKYGYWSGGHWPREMSIIAMGLHNAGYGEKAREVLIRAIMVDKGNIIPEVREPIGGKPSTKITKMACSIMNIISLLDIYEKIKWCEK